MAVKRESSVGFPKEILLQSNRDERRRALGGGSMMKSASTIMSSSRSMRSLLGGASVRSSPSKKAMSFAKGLAKLMVSSKDADAILANTAKLPPQRTPPELDRLQVATKVLPVFKALRNQKEKWRELCKVLRVKEVPGKSEWSLQGEQMFVVVLSGPVQVTAVDIAPLENILKESKAGISGLDENGRSNSTEPDPLGGMTAEDWRTVFEETDEDGSGTLSTEEIFWMLRSCGLEIELEAVEELVDELDEDGSGELDIDEFLILIPKLTESSGKWVLESATGWRKLFKAGTFFGEAALLGDSSRISATIAPVTDKGAKLMILDKEPYELILREGFDAYVAGRVQQLEQSCHLFRDLHAESDVKSLCFLVEDKLMLEAAPIIHQGSLASDLVVIADGVCKVVRKMEVDALEAAAKSVGWQTKLGKKLGGKGSNTIVAQRMKSARQPARARVRQIEISNIQRGDVCGEDCLLGSSGVNEVSVLASASSRVLRFPVKGLRQHLHKDDMWRIEEFCRMRKEYRTRQVNFKAAALLTTSSDSNAFAQLSYFKKMAKQASDDVRWLPLPSKAASALPQFPDNADKRRRPHPSEQKAREPAAPRITYATPQQIRQQAKEDLSAPAWRPDTTIRAILSNKSTSFKATNSTVRAMQRSILSSGLRLTDYSKLNAMANHVALMSMEVPESRHSRNARQREKMAGHRAVKQPALLQRQLPAMHIPLRSLPVDEDTILDMFDSQMMRTLPATQMCSVDVTLPKARRPAPEAAAVSTSLPALPVPLIRLPLLPSDFTSQEAERPLPLLLMGPDDDPLVSDLSEVVADGRQRVEPLGLAGPRPEYYEEVDAVQMADHRARQMLEDPRHGGARRKRDSPRERNGGTEMSLAVPRQAGGAKAGGKGRLMTGRRGRLAKRGNKPDPRVDSFEYRRVLEL